MAGRSVRRRAFLAVATAVLAVVGLADSAPAAAIAPAVVCQFSGATTQLTSPQFLPLPVVSGSSGTYVFTGAANCESLSSGTHLGIAFASAGSFRFTQCGTGTAWGNLNLTGIGSFDYEIVFSAAQGVLRSTSQGDNVAGAVSLLPQLGGCVTGPVTTFTGNGAFAGVIA